MISITSEQKLKPGILNKVKQLMLPDKNLEGFLTPDAKSLAYYLSGVLMVKDPAMYGLNTKVIDTIKGISGEILDTHEFAPMDFTEPSVLAGVITNLSGLNDGQIEGVINESLNPKFISVAVAKDCIYGLQKYLAYQEKRGALVKLFWA